MKGLKYGFGLILVGGFALTASCGGSSSDDSSSGTPSAGTSSSSAGTSSSSGGSNGTAGKSSGSGGTGTGTAGSSTGTGGSGNGTAGSSATGGASTGTGGTATGTGGTGTGTGGTGTGGGTTGTGGAAMNPAGCPPATPTPKNGDACTLGMTRTETCNYAADAGEQLTCTCAGAFVGPGGGAAGAADTMDGTRKSMAWHSVLPPSIQTEGVCSRGL